MKYSIGFLLFGILLLSLMINVFSNYWKAVSLYEESFRLKIEIQSNETKAVYADQRRLAYQRSFEAITKRKEVFEQAIPKFKDIADKYCVLQVNDPDLIHLVKSFTPALKDGFRGRFKIWIPENISAELLLGFYGKDKSWTKTKRLRPSESFDPPSLFKVPLTSGESMIDLSGQLQGDEFVLELRVNEALLHTSIRDMRNQNLTGTSSSHISMDDSISIKPESRLLFRFECECDQTDVENVGLAIEITDSESAE